MIGYDYDPLGRRITKKVNGSITEKYLWQGSIRLLAMYNGDNSLRYRFEYADGRMPLAMTDDSSTRYYLSRSGSGNSDRSISENLALKRPMNYGQGKEQENEKDKKESLGKFQGESGINSNQG